MNREKKKELFMIVTILSLFIIFSFMFFNSIAKSNEKLKNVESTYEGYLTMIDADGSDWVVLLDDTQYVFMKVYSGDFPGISLEIGEYYRFSLNHRGTLLEYEIVEGVDLDG